VSIDPMPPAGWRGIASHQDQAAIDTLPQRWQTALDLAKRRFPTRLKAEGPLVDLAAARPWPQLTPGTYWCRRVRLGGTAGYVASRADRCDVGGDKDRQSLTKLEGAVLPGGWLYTDDKPNRLIFLGALRLRLSDAAPGYGTVAGRDVIGLIERVAPFRWRFVAVGAGTPQDQIELYDLQPLVEAATARR
jgi:hypothetical protein